MFALSRDPASLLKFSAALAALAVTAGGAGDNAAANGISIDLLSPTRHEGVVFSVQATATLAAAATLTVTAKIQSSADGSSWTDAKAAETVLTLTGPGGGGTVTGVGEIGISLEYVDRYTRIVVTPNLSAANTDTATVTATAALFGASRLP